MPNKNLIHRLLATLIVVTITLAPFLDAVACPDCHLLIPQSNSPENYLTATEMNNPLFPNDFPAYTNASSDHRSERGDIPCPFCVFNTFGVISNSLPDFITSPTFFLIQNEPLALLEPFFLKTRPPKS